MNPPTAFTLARAYIALLRADLTTEAIAAAKSKLVLLGRNLQV